MDYQKVLAQFDELVDEGVVHHTEPQTTRVKDDGMMLEFVITDILVNKPQAEEDLQLLSETDPAKLAQRPECFGPGSDIAFLDPRLLLCKTKETHYLVFNLFSVFRPHLLLLTIDSYKRQNQPLEEVDFGAAFDVLHQLKDSGTSYYAFFNCGSLAGASRAHKHIQVLPKPAFLFPDQQDEHVKVPYKYILRRFDSPEYVYEPSNMKALYDGMLDRTKQLLGLPDETEVIPHNVVMTLDWLLVIPRRPVPGVNVSVPNAAGMMGSVWLSSEEKIDVWKSLGPMRILQTVGVPAN